MGAEPKSEGNFLIQGKAPGSRERTEGRGSLVGALGEGAAKFLQRL